jgi:hypothetical protein
MEGTVLKPGAVVKLDGLQYEGVRTKVADLPRPMTLKFERVDSVPQMSTMQKQKDVLVGDGTYKIELLEKEFVPAFRHTHDKHGVYPTFANNLNVPISVYYASGYDSPSPGAEVFLFELQAGENWSQYGGDSRRTCSVYPTSGSFIARRVDPGTKFRMIQPSSVMNHQPEPKQKLEISLSIPEQKPEPEPGPGPESEQTYTQPQSTLAESLILLERSALEVHASGVVVCEEKLVTLLLESTAPATAVAGTTPASTGFGGFGKLASAGTAAGSTGFGGLSFSKPSTAGGLFAKAGSAAGTAPASTGFGGFGKLASAGTAAGSTGFGGLSF